MGIATLTGVVSSQIFQSLHIEYGVTGACQQKCNSAFPCCYYLKFLNIFFNASSPKFQLEADAW